MANVKRSLYLLIAFLFVWLPGKYLHGQTNLFDRIGINIEHGLHGAVPEENIDLFTGNLTLRYLDIYLPGPNGLDVKVWRVYNSKIVRDRIIGGGDPAVQQEPYSWVGLGWTMHMGRLHSPTTENPIIEYPDGRQETLYRNKYDSNYFISKDFVKYDRDQHKLYFKDGVIWTFGAQRAIYYADHQELDVLSVIKIENSYGQHIDITYATNNAIMTTITDSMQRQITFTADYSQPSYPKLTQIGVENALGSLVYYNYSVGNFQPGNPASYHRLEQFDPPELPAVSFEYKNGLNNEYELTKANTCYGGYIRYDYAEHSFYYQNNTYILTRVVSLKYVKFTSGGQEKAWTYSYPDYQNVQTGTVTVAGPDYTQNVTYYAYAPNMEWRIGLISQKTFSDSSFTENYEWTPQQISEAHWVVLSTDMGPAIAPLMLTDTKIRSGDASSKIEYQYGTELIKYGLPTRINYYGNNLSSLKSYKTLQYYFENHSSYKTQDRYMLNYVSDEIIKDSNNNLIKETQTQYYELDNYWGAIDWIKRFRSPGTFLMWDYTYSYPSGSNNPSFIRIIIDLPQTAGTETYEYSYGVLSKIKRPGTPEYTELSRTISQHDSSISSEINQHAGTVNFTYDGLGRITAIVIPGFNNIYASWMPSGQNKVVITQGSNTVTKYWDQMGRDLGFEETGDGTTLYSRKILDSEGRVTEESKESVSTSNTYKYVLNAAGQATRITDPRGKQTNIVYSSNVKTVTDAESHATRFEYAGLPGLVTKLTDAQSRDALYTYDDIGRLAQVVYNNARTQIYTYDGLDNVTSETHPETGTISYTYNLENNLDQKMWGGVTFTHTYNSGNQLLTLASGDETITYSYDTKGRINSITSSLGWSRTGITYNPFGSVLTETQSIPGLTAKTLTYTYDGNNLPYQTIYPDNHGVTVTNNGLNVPETLVFATTTIINPMSYGPNKKPLQMTIAGNQTAFTATYDASGLLSTANLKKGTSTKYDASYEYDDVGNIILITSPSPTPQMDAAFGYDPLYRLISVTYTQDVGRVNSISYAYDNYGNMQTVQENGITAFNKTYNNHNQVVESFNYDTRGNLTSAPADGRYYFWDNQNRLRQIRDSSAQVLGDYLYNERGLRIFALLPAPEINVKQGTNNVPDGGSVTFTCPVESSIDKTFTIENLGDANLLLNGQPIIVIGGPDAGQFSVVPPQPTSPVSPAGSTSFTIRFHPSSVGNKTASIAISNNDADEGPYDIALHGNNPVPEINIKQGTNNILDGGSVSFTCNVGSYIEKSFTIENLGGGDLVLNGSPIIVIMGTNADQFNVQQQPTSPVSPGGSAPFIIRFQPTSSGDKTASIAIANNDSDENPYDITLNGHTPQPEIEIDQAEDGGTYDFGTIYIGDYWQTTFTVYNFGDADLVLSGTPIVRITGTGRSSFSVEQQPNSTIPPSQTTTFIIRFTAMSRGLKTAHISIANNDADENPYDITLTGTAQIGPNKMADDSSFTIISPSDGEEIVAGSALDISWTGGDSAKNVKIEYSSDTGSTYRTIAERAANTGSYHWRVPRDTSPSCLLRITDANGPSLVPELLSYEFAFKASRRQGAVSGTDQFVIHAGIPDNMTQIYRFADIVFAHDASTGKVSVLINSAPVAASLETDSFVEKWQQLRIQFDLRTETGSVWLDGGLMVENMPLNMQLAAESSPDISFSYGSGEPVQVWVDDLEVKLLDQTHKPQSEEEVLLMLKPLIWDGFNRYETGKFPEKGGWVTAQPPVSEASDGKAGTDTGINAVEGATAGAIRIATTGSRSLIDNQEYISGSQSFQLSSSGAPVQVVKRIDLPAKAPFGISDGTFAIVDRASIDRRSEDNAETKESGKKSGTRMGEREYTRQNKRLLIASSETRNAARVNGEKTSGNTTSSGTGNTTTILSAYPVGSYYIYSFDGKLLAEYNTLGQWLRDYIYIGNQLIAEYRGNGIYYYYTPDQVNSTRIVTDGSGNVVYSVAYDPYGGIQKTWGTPTYTPTLKFSGKERDQESQLDYFGARYHASFYYRWLSVDPVINRQEALVNPQLWNLYSFCRNSPVTFIDLFGLDNYVFYDPKNFPNQAQAEVKRLESKDKNEPTHAIPITTEEEFKKAWSSMVDPTDVTLIFHSGAGEAGPTTISIDASHDEYLTTNKSGLTPKGRQATYIGELEYKVFDTLVLYVCHAADPKAKDNVALTFWDTQGARIIIASPKYVNFNRSNYAPRNNTKWVYYIR